MTITIKYFGLLTEATQCHEESINFSGVLVSELLENLFSKYPALKHKNFQVAQNQVLVPVNTKLSGNEIALLPPYAGG
ncbi:MoaD/ThiS family protein [Snuella sedimenti]|uniref:MoaD/ThiS family protein n=1 Tax=Snuella sedimenti TaxID=2798802 RepID=A0A8J7IG80_9FLAO|nr:MoaD/ThiS family protein [Snuella sedimenti]MBJ6367263.1 MoaD/ThiS family protein [Snuella sedimenti]